MLARMVYEIRNKLMAWMEHGLQISLKRYALLTENKMVAGAFEEHMGVTYTVVYLITVEMFGQYLFCVCAV